MTEDVSTISTPNTSMKPPQRTNPNDIRNSDLVSRFLAATPPYLYSPPVGPNNYFFSEMLRSIVQSKTNEQNARNLSHFARRPRKRTWSRCMFDSLQTVSNLKELKENAIAEKSTPEKPLELTNKLAATNFPISSLPARVPKDNIKCNMRSNDDEKKESNTIVEPHNEPTTSLPPSDLVLPPPPPMWYPPLYPPYGIDPLHFFIDLRVSAAGHIYDRKKENVSPSNNNENNNTPASSSPSKMDSDGIGKPRLGSAFSVPPPRCNKSPLALNLSSSSCPSISGKNALIDYRNALFLEAEKDAAKNSKNTNYVLQNLPRIYTTMNPQHNEDRNSLISEDSDSKSELDLHEVKDDDRNFTTSDDVVIVDCQESNDGIVNNNNNTKSNSY